MFNPAQFKKKKKRVMDPNIVRPNLFSHEKKLKETAAGIGTMANRILQQEKQINHLESQIKDLRSSVNMVLDLLRRRK